MNEKISYKDNVLIINNSQVKFLHSIRSIKQVGNKILVLLAIPNNDKTINNLYAINYQGEIIWQSQDLNEIYVNQRVLPYEQIVVNDQEIKATDFYGRRYFININTGKIIKRDIVK